MSLQGENRRASSPLPDTSPASSKTLTLKDGSSLTGSFSPDGLLVHGLMVMANGNCYYGGFDDEGERSGRGLFVWTHGDVYEGSFVRGNMTGYGTYWYSNGDKYEGEWKDGKRHGAGTFHIRGTGSFFYCTWGNNQPRDGIWMNSQGAIYEGTFLNHKMHGIGIYTWPNGKSKKGEFRRGTLNQKTAKILPDHVPKWYIPQQFPTSVPSDFPTGATRAISAPRPPTLTLPTFPKGAIRVNDPTELNITGSCNPQESIPSPSVQHRVETTTTDPEDPQTDTDMDDLITLLSEISQVRGEKTPSPYTAPRSQTSSHHYTRGRVRSIHHDNAPTENLRDNTTKSNPQLPEISVSTDLSTVSANGASVASTSVTPGPTETPSIPTEPPETPSVAPSETSSGISTDTPSPPPPEVTKITCLFNSPPKSTPPVISASSTPDSTPLMSPVSSHASSSTALMLSAVVTASDSIQKHSSLSHPHIPVSSHSDQDHPRYLRPETQQLLKPTHIAPDSRRSIIHPRSHGHTTAANDTIHKRLPSVHGGVPLPKARGSLQDTYTLMHLLGEGISSTVYLAKHVKTEEYFAVKIIPKKILIGNAELAKEVKILKELKHPRVVRLVDLFVTTEALQIVMELAEGGELFEEIVSRKTFSEADAKEIINMILEGLLYLHDLGIVHRDLKPENLIWLYDPTSNTKTLKIIDFGFARYSHEAAMQSSAGTLGYKAPEVLSPSPDRPLSAKLDMWSLGVISYILLCGFPPFFSREDDRNEGMLGYAPFWVFFNDKTDELVEAITKGVYSFPEAFWGGVSQEGRSFVGGLLKVDPVERMSAREALEHEWFKGGEGQGSVETVVMIKKFEKSIRESRAGMKY